MKLPIQYAIIRFMPYVESEEFVNIGVVAFSPKSGEFDYRLVSSITRVNQFFPKLDRTLFRQMLSHLGNELFRIKSMLNGIPQGSLFVEDKDFARNVYETLIRERETMLRFSNDRFALTDGAFEEKVEELFNFYAFHSFATQPTQEQRMENELKTLFKNLAVRYVERDIGDGRLAVRIPFVHVEENRVVQAIKPLNLDQPSAAKVFEHGGLWVDKFRRLAKRRSMPDRMIVAVSEPQTGEMARAFTEIMDDLQELPLVVVSFEDRSRIQQMATSVFH